MDLFESGEMYLETILILSKEKESVHAVDIAHYRGYSKPSVSRAVGILKKGGLLEVKGDGAIVLTPEGLKTAKKIYDRHQVLSAFLEKLGVKESVAVEDACRIEHVISDTSMRVIKKWLKEHSDQP